MQTGQDLGQPGARYLGSREWRLRGQGADFGIHDGGIPRRNALPGGAGRQGNRGTGHRFGGREHYTARRRETVCFQNDAVDGPGGLLAAAGWEPLCYRLDPGRALYHHPDMLDWTGSAQRKLHELSAWEEHLAIFPLDFHFDYRAGLDGGHRRPKQLAVGEDAGHQLSGNARLGNGGVAQ